MEEPDRGAERLPLDEPINGKIADQEVRVLEISLIGARIEHSIRLSIGARWTLSFRWRDTDLRIPARVARTELRSVGGQMLYLSGLQFASSIEEAPEQLRLAMSSHVENEIEQQKWEPPPFFRQDDEDEDEYEELEAALPSATELPYLICTLEESGWSRQRTASPTMPREGFVMLARSEAEADEYCHSYAVADPDTRRLIRLSLELMVAHEAASES